jgi:hypothetical protein
MHKVQKTGMDKVVKNINISLQDVLLSLLTLEAALLVRMIRGQDDNPAKAMGFSEAASMVNRLVKDFVARGETESPKTENPRTVS